MSAISVFDHGAIRFPERPCLDDGARRRSYREVHDTTHRIALALAARGVRPGDKIATLSPNSTAMVEAMLGVYRAGAVYVPMNVLNGASENKVIADTNDVSVIFYHSKFKDLIDELLHDLPRVRLAVRLDADPQTGQGGLDDFIAGHQGLYAAPPSQALELSAIYSTGGTTGAPKGAMISQLAWQVQTANFYTAIPSRKPPVLLAATPMTHAAGCMAIYMFARGGLVVIHDKFEPDRFLADLSARRATHAHLPPTAIYMLLSHPDLRQHDYSALECFHYASAPMSVEKLRLCLEVFGPVMAQSWGQAEAPLVCTLLTPDDHRLALEDPAKAHLLSSCGRATLMTEVEVMDDAGRLLPVGERGELVMRGPLTGLGYYRRPEATASTFVGGWLHSGDIGYKDAEGYVYICDRKKEMIISGGLNVYPGEIEQVLWSHPAVQDCAVIGVPDEKWGEAVKAVVELKPGKTVSEIELLALCKKALGSVKTPKTVEFRDSLPRTAVGKVNKKDIRAPYWANHSRKI